MAASVALNGRSYLAKDLVGEQDICLRRSYLFHLLRSFLRLNNFHGRGMRNVYYLPELLYIFEGEVFDNEPPEFPSSDLTEDGEGAEQTEFE